MLKNYYEEFLRTGFFNNRNILLQSFIEYYGKEYEDILTSRFNDIEFVFYFNENNRNKLKEMGEKYENIKPNIRDLEVNYTNLKYELKNKNKYATESDRIRNRILYSTTPTALLNDDILKNFNDTVFLNEGICMKGISFDDEYVRYVFIPLFHANDACIIHEIIHALTSNVLAKLNGETIEKWGFVTKQDYYRDSYLEEAITELEASKINKIFVQKGGKFINETYPFKNFFATYLLLLPLINDFYEEFKEDIIFSRLTLNKNKILNLCGKDNYLNFTTAVDECYQYFPKPSSEDFYDYVSISRSCVDKMKKNYSLELRK